MMTNAEFKKLVEEKRKQEVNNIPRKKKYVSNAERQKAYRLRKQQQMQNRVNLVDSMSINLLDLKAVLRKIKRSKAGNYQAYFNEKEYETIKTFLEEF